MEFLYGDLPRPRRNELEKHVNECELCLQQRAEYEQTMKQLDTWQVARSATVQTQVAWPGLVKWAAAAAFLVTTGFAAARLSAPPALRPEMIEAQVTEPLREKISRELNAKVEREVNLASERGLDAVKSKLQAEWTERMRLVAERAAAEALVTQQQFAEALATLKDRDTALYAGLQQIEAKRQSEYRALREDLEKVALFTDQSVRSTERQLVQLSSLNQNAR